MKTRTRIRCLAAAMLPALMALSFAAAAQEEGAEAAPPAKLFVTDKLVLNVYSEPSEMSSRIASIESGEVVEALERVGAFVHVRLANEREGFVGANFLTEEAPAAVRLQQMQRDQKSAVQAAEKKAAEEIASLKKQNKEIQAEIDALKKQAESAAEAASAAAEAALERAQEDEVEAQLAAAAEREEPAGVAWMWPVLALATGAGGFALGYQTLGRRIRNKFGGLKIY